MTCCSKNESSLLDYLVLTFTFDSSAHANTSVSIGLVDMELKATITIKHSCSPG